MVIAIDKSIAMKELLYENFTSTIRELNQLSRFNKQKVESREEILKNIKAANDLINLGYSSLNIFYHTVKCYVSVDRLNKLTDFDNCLIDARSEPLPITEIKSIYNQLLKIINHEYSDEFNRKDRTIVFEKENTFLIPFHRTPTLNNELKEFSSIIDFTDYMLTDLQNILDKYTKGIERFIDDILYENIYLLFEERTVIHNYTPSKNKKDYTKIYTDKWINCKVTLSDMHLNSRRDYWTEIRKRELDDVTIEKILEHQKKLFFEKLKIEVRCACLDLDDLSKKNRLISITNEINLVESFLKGDTSEVLSKRLKNRYHFKSLEEVLIEYDNVVLNLVSIFDFEIYEYCSREYSAVFKAYFFMEYLKKIKKKLKPKKKSSKNKKATPNTFKKLIPQSDKQAYILQLLENLSITNNGKSVLTPRKKGALRGVVEALKHKCIIPNKGIHTLCKIIAEEIQLELKSELDASTTSEKYKKVALDYIKNNPFR